MFEERTVIRLEEDSSDGRDSLITSRAQRKQSPESDGQLRLLGDIMMLMLDMVLMRKQLSPAAGRRKSQPVSPVCE
jgi:hypothetical protein